MAERFIQFVPSRGDTVEIGDCITLIEQLPPRRVQHGPVFLRFSGRVVESTGDQLTVFLLEAQPLGGDLSAITDGTVDEWHLFRRITVNRTHVEAFQKASSP